MPSDRAVLSDADWTVCIHSSGNEPGCAACWHGAALRANIENDRLLDLLAAGHQMLLADEPYDPHDWCDEVMELLLDRNRRAKEAANG